MLNRQNPRYAAQTLIPISSSGLLELGVLDTLYAGRARTARPAKASAQSREARIAGPEAIWGQYNNYRSNGVALSVVIHIALIGLILAGATFGHQVVEQVKQREVVTLIAPSPDSCNLTSG